jgi:hypothetical protein
MNYKLKQGEDLLVEIPVIDENNNKIDLSTATKIRVSLNVRGIEAYKYADLTLEVALTGYGEVTIDSVDATKLNLIVTRDQSKLFPLGELTGTVLIEFPDATLTNRREEFTYVLGTVIKGVLKNEVLS